MIAALAFVFGLVFGTGLLLAQMTRPDKVLGFLDLAGRWDPSLALVMAGAIAVALPAFAWARRREAAGEGTLLGASFRMPTATRADRRLLAGAALFGLGWGLTGICPGPALVLLGASPFGGSDVLDIIAFVASMIVGMWLASRKST
jgi:uncharacterized protein